MNAHTELGRTPLYPLHKEAGARFVPFAGWEMPVQYSGLIDEHLTVRAHAGIFDVSHMGEIRVTGRRAAEFLQYVTTNDVARIGRRQAQYTLLLNEQGGVLDDIIIYRLGQEEFFLCVNSANARSDFDWLTQQNRFDVKLEDQSDAYAQIAVQGPEAPAMVARLCDLDDADVTPGAFPYFSFRELGMRAADSELRVLIARTGYTGEDGFELFLPAEAACAVWQSLLELAPLFDAKPIGLGARDTLRLEVCYPLHGHELRPDVCALFSNVAWAIKLQKGDFIGRAALLKEKERGAALQLCGLAMRSPGIARADDAVFYRGQEVGWVTSGTKPPTVSQAVAMAFLPPAAARVGTEVEVEVRGKRLRAGVTEQPFVKPFSKR